MIFKHSPLLDLQARFPSSQSDHELAAGTSIAYAQGCPIRDVGSAAGIAAAAGVAAAADIVLLFLGLNSEVEDESLDRAVLGLPGNQSQLLHAVLQSVGPNTKVITVLINGGIVAIPELKESPKVDVCLLSCFGPAIVG